MFNNIIIKVDNLSVRKRTIITEFEKHLTKALLTLSLPKTMFLERGKTDVSKHNFHMYIT